MHVLERVGWLVVALALAAFAIPWFLWGDDAVFAGLPVWLWWHVGWMLFAALVFRLFAERAWGLGIEPEFGERGGPASDPVADGASDERGDRGAGGGERR